MPLSDNLVAGWSDNDKPDSQPTFSKPTPEESELLRSAYEYVKSVSPRIPDFDALRHYKGKDGSTYSFAYELAPEQIDWLYNNSDGKTYEELAAHNKETADLIADALIDYWKSTPTESPSD